MKKRVHAEHYAMDLKKLYRRVSKKSAEFWCRYVERRILRVFVDIAEVRSTFRRVVSSMQVE